jgi:hypothetical protein
VSVGLTLHFILSKQEIKSGFMNRLNQTEPATFSILPCWAFFRDSVFLYFTASETHRGMEKDTDDRVCPIL